MSYPRGGGLIPPFDKIRIKLEDGEVVIAFSDLRADTLSKIIEELSGKSESKMPKADPDIVTNMEGDKKELRKLKDYIRSRNDEEKK